MGTAERVKNAVRERLESLDRQVDLVMGLLGLLLFVVVLVEPLSPGPVADILAGVGYLLWATFIAEFLVRVWVAPDRRRYLRRNWWLIIVLAVPFLRVFQGLRIAAVARGVVSIVRGSTSAARLLSERLAWLAAVTALVVVTTSYMLYLTGVFPSYATALHHSAISTITGEPLGSETGLAQVLDVVLASYSVVIFATLAGSIGAFFLRGRSQDGRGRSGEDQ